MGRERGGDNPWTEDDFYASGAAEWEVIRPRWEDYAGALGGTTIEIGCGAGRMSRQLAGVFDRVVALDVSSDQLELTRTAIADRPATGEFRLSTGSALAASDAEANAVFSTHVFQHLPPRLAGSLLTDCGRALVPGGTVMLHVPIPGSNLAGTQFGDVVRRWTGVAPLRAAALRVGHRLGRTVPPMRFQVFDPAWVFDRLERGGLVDTQLRTFDVGGMRLAFFTARRPHG